MNVLSLFDGISCARVALERANIKVDNYFASEVDKFAISVSNKNYPDIIQLGDVKNIHAGAMPIDLLVAGFPCQAFSIAGNRKEFEDPRGQLVYELIRLLKEIKPKYFIGENVASMKKEIQEQLRQEFEKALGKPVYIYQINGALVSAQNRKRVWFTNIPNIQQPENKGLILQDIIEDGDVDRLKSYCIDASYYKGANWEQYITKKRRQLVRIGHINNGAQGDRIYSPEGKAITLQASGGGFATGTGLYALAMRNRGNGKQPEVGARKANSLTTVQTDSMILDSDDLVVRKLTPLECERLTTLPDNYTQLGVSEKGEVNISNSQRYKMCGNAFQPAILEHILKSIYAKN